GGDASAVRLAALIRAWPAQRQTRRALSGLEALRAIGSDTALMELSNIAHKVRFRKLQQTATGFMFDIASERGLSPARLEDRIVPDLGLDGRGKRAFDFGPRQFDLILSRDLKPMVKDEKGRLRAELPKPNTKDDPAKAACAQAAWKLIKKQLRDILSAQSTRLESAMLTQRAWSVGEFQTYLVRHPVMGQLTQRLLWAGRDAQAARFFRVNED